jgi:hypothetical protein
MMEVIRLLLIFLILLEYPNQQKKDTINRKDTTKRVVQNRSNKNEPTLIDNKNKEFTLTTSEWISLIGAITTIIYTVVTYMLWKSTRDTLLLSLEQSNENRKRLEGQVLSDVYKNFQSIFSMFLNDKENIKLLAEERHTTSQDIRKRYLATFLINHSYDVFRSNEAKLLPKSFWDTFVIDIKGLYTWGFISARWKQVRHMYPEDFRNFLDNEILSKQEEL